MTLGANQIGAYAADLLDLEDQIEALQEGKRDLYATIRDEHGKAEANALKQAVKLSRMDSEKRTERDEIDTEAQRMLAIIEKSRAPRATHAIAKDVPVSTPVTHAAGQGEGTAPGSLASTNPDGMASGSGEDPNAQSVSPRAAESVNAGGSDEAVTPLATDTVRAEAATPVASAPTAADQVRKQRPWCLHPDNLNQCAGHGKVHCHGCLKAHADAEGLSA